MNILLLALLVLLPTSQSYNKMVVIWATPKAYTTFSSSNLGWNDCLDACLDSIDCVLVSNQTANKCVMFALSQITSVKQLTSSDRLLVAFKVRLNSSVCPAPDSAPLVNGNPASGGVLDRSDRLNQTYNPYTVKYSKGLWTFSLGTKLYCGFGGYIFDRPLGPWCIWTFNSVTQDRKKAVSYCLSNAVLKGGVLSGIQSLEEYTYIRDRYVGQANGAKKFSEYKKIGIWLDGVRRTKCQAPSTRSAGCNGTNEFSFSDPMLLSPGYYAWMSGQPSGILSNPTTKNCMEMTITTANQGISDVSCDTECSGSVCQWGTLCGKKPQ